MGTKADPTLEDVISSVEDLIRSIAHHREALSEDQFQESVFVILRVMLTVVKDIRDGN
jgi:hypothetical protein